MGVQRRRPGEQVRRNEGNSQNCIVVKFNRVVARTSSERTQGDERNH